MHVVGIIPARFKSSRYPGKPLVNLLNKPMVVWVAELSSKALGKENVYVATDDKRIAKAVEDYGYNFVMTSDSAPTGTDRLWDASKKMRADIYVNIQGDEPLVNPDDILRIVKEKKEHPECVINGMCRLGKDEVPASRNIPKVVFTEDGRLVYMSRLPVPGAKTAEGAPRIYWKQVCIYAFNSLELKMFGEFGRKSDIEKYEDIEILRFFEFGTTVRMVETSGSSYAIDVPEDVVVVEEALKLVHGNEA